MPQSDGAQQPQLPPQLRRTGTPDRQHSQHHRGSRGTPDRHRATPDRASHVGRGGTHPDRLQRQRSTPERSHHQRAGSNTPDRHGARNTPDRHGPRSTPDRHHHNSRRQRRHSANEALLAKRRAEVLRERRILIIMTSLCCLASTIWLVALSTDYWVLVDAVRPQRSSRNVTAGNDTNALVPSSIPAGQEAEKQLNSHLGIWRGCIVQRDPAGDGCTFHNLDHDDQEFVLLPSVAHVIIDYRRTVMALAVLSLLCHVMAVSFSFYTFRNPRYTFKRLAGCIHLITAATMVVLIEVVSNGAAFARLHLHSLFPPGSESYHGFSYYLAWLVAAQFAGAGLAFLIFSRKRKNLNITDEIGRPLSDDQPRVMGR